MNYDVFIIILLGIILLVLSIIALKLREITPFYQDKGKMVSELKSIIKEYKKKYNS